jgi:hypothetical protein
VREVRERGPQPTSLPFVLAGGTVPTPRHGHPLGRIDAKVTGWEGLSGRVLPGMVPKPLLFGKPDPGRPIGATLHDPSLALDRTQVGLPRQSKDGIGWGPSPRTDALPPHGGAGNLLVRMGGLYLFKGETVQAIMSPKRFKSPRKARGAQQWILSELRSIGSGASLSTSEVAERISTASGKKYHMASVYLALRTLEDRGDIKSERLGQEKSFRVVDAPYARGSDSPLPIKASASRDSVPESTVPGSPIYLDFGVRASNLAHKLALGEILVLEIEAGEVLAATNLHGRLTLERQPFPH